MTSLSQIRDCIQKSTETNLDFYKRTIESRDKYFCVTGTESKRIAITASAAIWNLDAGYKNVSTPIREIFQLIKSRSRALHYRHQFESQTKRRMSPEFQRHLV